jgi:8-oxo-dGTP pyrophosphatase MutT (NUDIX family)
VLKKFISKNNPENTNIRYLRGVYVKIYNAAGKVLLVQHKGEKDHFWTLPGGAVEKNENIFNAACREILEELHIDIRGLSLKKERIVSYLLPEPYRKDKLTYNGKQKTIIKVNIPDSLSKNIKINNAEIHAIRWVSLKHITEVRLYKSILNTFAN